MGNGHGPGEQVAPSRADLAVLEERLKRLEAAAPDPDAVRQQLDPATAARLDDRFYALFQDKFRGSIEEIRKRQEYCLAFIEAAGAGASETPILDLGCGRGEWLKLLRDAGKIATGLECNEIFIERCRKEGLCIERGEAMQHMESIAPASVGAITGFHIIEHLPADQQIRLVQLAFRALRPGGVLILETPNPENLNVAALWFYVDPTHIRPIPSTLLEFVAKYVGFVNISIERRAPLDESETPLGWSRFQDYALVAFRPKDV
jgi:O-antigen chain-terminating methyltransferase